MLARVATAATNLPQFTNLTFYSDAACTEYFNGPVYLPTTTPPSCLPDDTDTVSVLVSCNATAGVINLTATVWSSASNNCSGTPNSVLTGVAKQDSCALLTLTAYFGNNQSKSVQYPATVQCNVSSSGQADAESRSTGGSLQTLQALRNLAVGVAVDEFVPLRQARSQWTVRQCSRWMCWLSDGSLELWCVVYNRLVLRS